MMLRTLFLAALVGSSQAFVTPSPATLSTKLFDKYVGSGMTEHEIPLLIDNLNQDNFLESLEMLEPLLTNECVGDQCDAFVGQLKEKASAIGKELPKGYAASHH